MKNQIVLWTAFTIGLWTYVACSQVKFSSAVNCDSVTSGQCSVSNSGERSISDSVTIKGGKVDILIVDDNSASMSFEQSHLADRFANFVNMMDSKSIDYRVGFTTTDISTSSNNPRAINLNGALQDGRLIPMDGGYKFLTPDMGTIATRNSIFNSTIKRPETLSCESFIVSWVDSGKSMATAEYSDNYKANCPSTDERGLYAANLVVENNPESFLRPEADLAVIVLSDEDVRSQQYWNHTPGFDLDVKDTAQGLVDEVKNKMSSKKFAVHSIITTTQSCLNIQNSQTRGVVSGSYGWEYNKASQLTGGVVGDICSNDYTIQLKNIFDNMTTNIVDKISLYCSSPKELNVSAQGYAYTVQGAQIIFSQKLPVGTTVSFSYKCPAAIN